MAQYTVTLESGRAISVVADSVTSAINVAEAFAIEQFAKEWARGIVSVRRKPDSHIQLLCAVDQNEVVCAHPGCTGPYNCKERGLQE